MEAKITARVMAVVKPQDKPYQIHDTACVGFIVRVQPTGASSYYFMYRASTGERRKILIGKVSDWTLTEAREKAEEYRNAVARGGDPGAVEVLVESMTLRRFIMEVWSPAYKATRKAHDQQLIRLLSGFKPMLDLPLTDLTRTMFERHMVERASTPLTKGEKLPASATLNRCNATMRPVLEMARKSGLIPTNPLADVAKAREDKNRAIRPMTVEEEQAIEAVFTQRRDARLAEVAELNMRRKRPLPPVPKYLDYLQPMFILSLESGIRRGEAFSLTWADVDMDARKLTVRGEVAKSSQSRVVPLTKRAHATLADWKEQGMGEGLVFPSRIGGGRLKNIDRAWRDLCKDAKITGLRWHDIRHSFGSRAALAGVPMVVLKNLMGHSAISTTMRYAHSTEADARAAIALLDR